MPTFTGTATEVDAYLSQFSSALPYSTWYRVAVGFKTSHPQLAGGTHYIEGFKTSDTYEYQTATSYNATGAKHFRRSKNNGVWNAWSA